MQLQEPIAFNDERRGKKSSKSKKNKQKTQSEGGMSRDTLLAMVSQEMASSWLDEPKQNLTSEELFYSQMNGERAEHESTGFNLPDDYSIHDRIRKARQTKRSIEQNMERRNKCERNLSDQTSLTTKSSDSECGSMSIEEIQRVVMASLPEDLMKKIPKEAWGEMFGPSRADIVKKPCNMTITQDDETSDDLPSVVSDLTMNISSVSVKKSRSQAAPKAPEEVYDDYDICPTLETTRHFRDSQSYTTSSSYSRSLSKDCAGAVTRNKQSGVSFSTVQVRYYEQILDINPAVSNGAAVGLGWRYKKGSKSTVEEWEMQRIAGTRSAHELVMPRHVREVMLKELGYEQKDIAVATRMILKAKNQRKVTVQNLGVQGVEQAVEEASRRVKGLLSFGRNRGLFKRY